MFRHTVLTAALILAGITAPAGFINPVGSAAATVRPDTVGVEAGAGWMPALALWPALPAAHDFTTVGFGARIRHRGHAADWVLRLAFLDLRFQDGDYLGRGHGWEDVQHVWFDPVRALYLQVNREREFARTRGWRWYWSAGGGLGWLDGAMLLQNAQGCDASNWRHPDTDPTWGGCYHDPDPYPASVVDFPPVMAFLHGAVGARRRIGAATLHAEAGFYLPGFFGFILAVEWDFPD